MPLLKIFTTHAPSTEGATALADSLSGACTELLGARDDAVQILLVPGSMMLRGEPLLVEVHYRAKPERSVDIMDRFMDRISQGCSHLLGQRPRIRCFAVDQATLFARH